MPDIRKGERYQLSGCVWIFTQKCTVEPVPLEESKSPKRNNNQGYKKWRNVGLDKFLKVVDCHCGGGRFLFALQPANVLITTMEREHRSRNAAA